MDCDRVLENQRFIVGIGWVKASSLTLLDWPAWSTPKGEPVDFTDSPPQPDGSNGWHVQHSNSTDHDGWLYAFKFTQINTPRAGGRASRRPTDLVRSRVWAKVDQAATEPTTTAAHAAPPHPRAPLHQQRPRLQKPTMARFWVILLSMLREVQARRQLDIGLLDPAGLLLVVRSHQATIRHQQLSHLPARTPIWPPPAPPAPPPHPPTTPPAHPTGATADPPSATPAAALPPGAVNAPPQQPPPQLTPHQQRQRRRQLLLDLHCAAVHSRAAYGFLMSEGHLSSVTRFAAMHLHNGMLWDLLGGVSHEAHTQALQQLTGVPAADVLEAVWDSTTFRPCHYLVIDRARRRVVLSVRGSVDWGDICTDLNAEPMEVELGGAAGQVHQGLMSAALYVQGRTLQGLREAARRAPGWPVFVTGHSLGGGVAALVAMLLRQPGALPPELGAVRCVAIGPAAVMSEQLARSCASYVASVVLQNDMVPRLSLHSVERLLLHMNSASTLTRIRTALSSFPTLLSTPAAPPPDPPTAPPGPPPPRPGAAGLQQMLGQTPPPHPTTPTSPAMPSRHQGDPCDPQPITPRYTSSARLLRNPSHPLSSPPAAVPAPRPHPASGPIIAQPAPPHYPTPPPRPHPHPNPTSIELQPLHLDLDPEHASTAPQPPTNPPGLHPLPDASLDLPPPLLPPGTILWILPGDLDATARSASSAAAATLAADAAHAADDLADAAAAAAAMNLTPTAAAAVPATTTDSSSPTAAAAAPATTFKCSTPIGPHPHPNPTAAAAAPATTTSASSPNVPHRHPHSLALDPEPFRAAAISHCTGSQPKPATTTSPAPSNNPTPLRPMTTTTQPPTHPPQARSRPYSSTDGSCPAASHISCSAPPLATSDPQVSPTSPPCPSTQPPRPHSTPPRVELASLTGATRRATPTLTIPQAPAARPCTPSPRHPLSSTSTHPLQTPSDPSPPQPLTGATFLHLSHAPEVSPVAVSITSSPSSPLHISRSSSPNPATTPPAPVPTDPTTTDHHISPKPIQPPSSPAPHPTASHPLQSLPLHTRPPQATHPTAIHPLLQPLPPLQPQTPDPPAPPPPTHPLADNPHSVTAIPIPSDPTATLLPDSGFFAAPQDPTPGDDSAASMPTLGALLSGGLKKLQSNLRQALTSPAKPRPVVVEASAECFSHLLLSTAGVLDHIPDSYLDAVQELLIADNEWQQQEDRLHRLRLRPTA